MSEIDYRGGVEFITAFASCGGRAFVNNFADRPYCTLQYQHYGRIHFAMSDGSKFAADAPSLLVTMPGARCSFGNAREPWHHNYLGVRGPRLERMIEQGLFPTSPGADCLYFKIKNGDAFFAIFRDCVGHARAGSALENAFASNSFERLLLYLAHERELPDAGRSVQRLDELLRQMRASPTSSWDLRREARKLRASEGHFVRLFKKAAGAPPKRFLVKCRLDLAADLLATSPDPIKSVAEQAGFDDLQYFYRKFKEAKSTTPAEFRRKFSRVYGIGEGVAPAEPS